MKKLAAYLVLAFTVLSCTTVPEYVIPPDEMADLLADLHVGESYADANFADYSTDSARMLIKQSVVEAHGYTLKDLDTSFMWYGHNLKTYREVYDNTLEKLNRRLEDLGSAPMKLRPDTAAPQDSVDEWEYSPRLNFNARQPTPYVTFDLKKTPEWKTGDSFTWRAKVTNAPDIIKFDITAHYSDGTFEVLTTRMGGDGWHETTFFMDSTRMPEEVHGSIDIPLPDDKSAGIYLDSIQLIRKPLDARTYPQRYRQKSYRPRYSN